ncbi:hypothetical protein APHAL10511_000737 [Amanita phalloides]|nr:hypothetical protein APHAL10511_000737 [Amanita phalloides]
MHLWGFLTPSEKYRHCLDAATGCGSSASIGGSQSPPRTEVADEVPLSSFDLLPLDTAAGSAENQFWETIRRAKTSFDKHGRASRRFHQAKRSVDQTFPWFSDAEQYLRLSPGPGLVEESRLPASDEENSPHDADRGNSFSSSCSTREARLKAGEAQIAPIIDAMEARAARVEQLADEMERLFIDTQNLLYRMTRYR